MISKFYLFFVVVFTDNDKTVHLNCMCICICIYKCYICCKSPKIYTYTVSYRYSSPQPADRCSVGHIVPCYIRSCTCYKYLHYSMKLPDCYLTPKLHVLFPCTYMYMSACTVFVHSLKLGRIALYVAGDNLKCYLIFLSRNSGVHLGSSHKRQDRFDSCAFMRSHSWCTRYTLRTFCSTLLQLDLWILTGNHIFSSLGWH